jgi:hypothetical protein
MSEQVTHVVRGKFRCDTATKTEYAEHIKLSAVCDDSTPQNKRFHESTPTGSLDFYVTNKALWGHCIPGKFYYLDMTEAPK